MLNTNRTEYSTRYDIPFVVDPIHPYEKYYMAFYERNKKAFNFDEDDAIRLYQQKV